MTQLPEGPPGVPWVAQDRDPTWTCALSAGDAREFHRTLPDYAVTPLVPLAGLAEELGVGQVFAKDESTRLGLPAFKALGASWAVRQVSAEQPGRALTLTTATDGNHGRAVARFARLLGHGARIFVPPGLHSDAVAAIRHEGAEVVVIDGSYDDAVAAAARAGREPAAELVQDTAWEGYEQVPRWIVDGYGTLFAELDEQLAAAGCFGPDLVAVPTGVGSLLQAALAHYRSADAAPGTAVVSVEPDTAAWGPASLLAGKPVSVRTGRTVMHGLNCGTPSSAAWPFVIAGLDGAVTVTDEAAITAARELAALGLAAGPCGAAPVAALRSLLGGPGDGERRRHLGLGPDATVVVLVTEGSAANPLPGATA